MLLILLLQKKQKHTHTHRPIRQIQDKENIK